MSQSKTVEKETLFLLDGLTEQQKSDCFSRENGTVCCYKNGDVIYDSTHSLPALVMVTAGSVRVWQGKVLLNELTAGACFGVAALFGEAQSYPSRVVAHGSCCVILISQDEIRRWMASYPIVAENYIRFLSDRVRFLNRKVALFTATDASHTVWQYLSSHADETGRGQTAGGMAALARELNMSRSSLYRAWESLEQAGWLRRLDSKSYQIKNREGLL